jgi:hypothetical protein
MVRRIISFIQNNTNFFVFFLIFFSVLWVCRFFLKYDYFYAHDLDFNLARGYEAFLMLKSGHFPLRWASDLNNSCGVAVFNFFYPLGYYLMAFFYFLFKDILLSWKVLVFLSLFCGSWFFYLWAKNETGDSWSSFLGAFLYLFAPYRFLLSFVRGSLEFLSYAIFPIILFLLSSFLKEKNSKKRRLYLFSFSIFLALFLLSHNIVVMILFPFLVLISFISVFKNKLITKKERFLFIFSFISGIGITSFFISPALLEKSYVKLGVLKTVEYKDHFPTLFQLFRSPWGYLFSNPGVNDGMSFMLGYSQWLILIISFFVIFYLFYSKRKKIFLTFLENFWTFFYFFFSLFTIFLILPSSLFIWEKLRILQEVQYPWRFLGVAIFFISALSFHLFSHLKKNYLYFLLYFLVIFLVLFGNRNHLRVMPLYDNKNLWQNQEALFSSVGTTTIADEILSVNAESACYVNQDFIVEPSNLPYSFVLRNSVSGQLKFKINDEKPDKFVFSLEYFPDIYTFNVNGKDVSYSDCNGRVCIDSREFKSYNLLSWNLKQTKVEKFFNLLSLLFLFLLVFLLFGFYKNKKLVFIFLTLSLFLFFRFYNLDFRLPFAWDQERDAFAVKNILQGKLTLLGPRVVGPTGFYLPPYFFYLLSPFYFLFNFSVYPSLVSFLFVYWILFFFIGTFSLNKFFGNRIALLFFLIWTFVPSAILADRVVWNPLFIPLFFFILILFLGNYLKSGKTSLFFVLSLAYFLGISFHPQFFFYLPFVALALVEGGRRKFSRNIILFFLSFVIVFSPIVIFDFRHNFLNLNLILNFNHPRLLEGNFLDVWRNFVSLFFSFNFSKLSSLFFLVLLILFFVINYRLEENRVKKNILVALPSSLILSFLFFAFVYRSRPSEYYFNFSLPIIVLGISLFFERIIFVKNKVIKIISVLLFLVYFSFIVKSSILHFKPDSESLYFKLKIVDSIKSITKDRNFDVSLDSKNGKDAGFYYLLDFYKIPFNKKDGSSLIRITEPADDKCLISYGVYSICFMPEDFNW